jgi:site-specific recombinase XerC
MISILLGCGLRRAELSGLEVDDLQIKQGHWAIVDLVGKGGHVRTVPMPAWVKAAVDRWTSAAKVTTGDLPSNQPSRNPVGQRIVPKRDLVRGSEMRRQEAARSPCSA